MVTIWLNACSMVDKLPKETAQQRAYRAFEALLVREDRSIDLAHAALIIASTEYPDLDNAYYLSQLDALARRVRAILALPTQDILPQLPAEVDLLSVLQAIHAVLVDEEHFHGNQQDYDNPQNSFLNRVLEEHTGIPITLSLLYMEVGKRIGIQLDGFGFPYHFMVGCHLPQGMVYIDPFYDGQILSARDCAEHIRQIAQRRIKLHPHHFEPVTQHRLLVRMLNNLKHIYIDQEDFERALTICDLILLLMPAEALERRNRGYLHLQLKHYARAKYDLATYLEFRPQAEDRYEIQNYLSAIRQIMALMN